MQQPHDPSQVPADSDGEAPALDSYDTVAANVSNLKITRNPINNTSKH